MDKTKSKRRTSILKRQNAEEGSPTETMTLKNKRRISFSGKKSVKEFCAGENAETIWGTSYEESANSSFVNTTMPCNDNNFNWEFSNNGADNQQGGKKDWESIQKMYLSQQASDYLDNDKENAIYHLLENERKKEKSKISFGGISQTAAHSKIPIPSMTITPDMDISVRSQVKHQKQADESKNNLTASSFRFLHDNRLNCTLNKSEKHIFDVQSVLEDELDSITLNSTEFLIVKNLKKKLKSPKKMLTKSLVESGDLSINPFEIDMSMNKMNTTEGFLEIEQIIEKSQITNKDNFESNSMVVDDTLKESSPNKCQGKSLIFEDKKIDVEDREATDFANKLTSFTFKDELDLTLTDKETKKKDEVRAIENEIEQEPEDMIIDCSMVSSDDKKTAKNRKTILLNENIKYEFVKPKSNDYTRDETPSDKINLDMSTVTVNKAKEVSKKRQTIIFNENIETISTKEAESQIGLQDIDMDLSISLSGGMEVSLPKPKTIFLHKKLEPPFIKTKKSILNSDDMKLDCSIDIHRSEQMETETKKNKSSEDGIDNMNIDCSHIVTNPEANSFKKRQTINFANDNIITEPSNDNNESKIQTKKNKSSEDGIDNMNIDCSHIVTNPEGNSFKKRQTINFANDNIITEPSNDNNESKIHMPQKNIYDMEIDGSLDHKQNIFCYNVNKKFDETADLLNELDHPPEIFDDKGTQSFKIDHNISICEPVTNNLHINQRTDQTNIADMSLEPNNLKSAILRPDENLTLQAQTTICEEADFSFETSPKSVSLMSLSIRPESKEAYKDIEIPFLEDISVDEPIARAREVVNMVENVVNTATPNTDVQSNPQFKINTRTDEMRITHLPTDFGLDESQTQLKESSQKTCESSRNSLAKRKSISEVVDMEINEELTADIRSFINKSENKTTSQKKPEFVSKSLQNNWNNDELIQDYDQMVIKGNDNEKNCEVDKYQNKIVSSNEYEDVFKDDDNESKQVLKKDVKQIVKNEYHKISEGCSNEGKLANCGISTYQENEDTASSVRTESVIISCFKNQKNQEEDNIIFNNKKPETDSIRNNSSTFLRKPATNITLPRRSVHMDIGFEQQEQSIVYNSERHVESSIAQNNTKTVDAESNLCYYSKIENKTETSVIQSSKIIHKCTPPEAPTVKRSNVMHLNNKNLSSKVTRKTIIFESENAHVEIDNQEEQTTNANQNLELQCKSKKRQTILASSKISEFELTGIMALDESVCIRPLDSILNPELPKCVESVIKTGKSNCLVENSNIDMSVCDDLKEDTSVKITELQKIAEKIDLFQNRIIDDDFNQNIEKEILEVTKSIHNLSVLNISIDEQDFPEIVENNPVAKCNLKKRQTINFQEHKEMESGMDFSTVQIKPQELNVESITKKPPKDISKTVQNESVGRSPKKGLRLTPSKSTSKSPMKGILLTPSKSGHKSPFKGILLVHTPRKTLSASKSESMTKDLNPSRLSNSYSRVLNFDEMKPPKISFNKDILKQTPVNRCPEKMNDTDSPIVFVSVNENCSKSFFNLNPNCEDEIDKTKISLVETTLDSGSNSITESAEINEVVKIEIKQEVKSITNAVSTQDRKMRRSSMSRRASFCDKVCSKCKKCRLSMDATEIDNFKLESECVQLIDFSDLDRFKNLPTIRDVWLAHERRQATRYSLDLISNQSQNKDAESLSKDCEPNLDEFLDNYLKNLEESSLKKIQIENCLPFANKFELHLKEKFPELKTNWKTKVCSFKNANHIIITNVKCPTFELIIECSPLHFQSDDLTFSNIYTRKSCIYTEDLWLPYDKLLDIEVAKKLPSAKKILRNYSRFKNLRDCLKMLDEIVLEATDSLRELMRVIVCSNASLEYYNDSVAIIKTHRHQSAQNKIIKTPIIVQINKISEISIRNIISPPISDFTITAIKGFPIGIKFIELILSDPISYLSVF